MKRLLLCFVALFAACKLQPLACRKGTLLLDVTLSGSAASADGLFVTIAIAGDAPKTTSIAHASGTSTGTVEVEFPSGYPSGAAITVDVSAFAQGEELGSGSTRVSLDASCATASITVTGGTKDAGIDFSGVDLAGRDLTTPNYDLTTKTPDLYSCTPKTENCFNGADDDCDGKIDCEDPDCSATATCVPSDPGATYGTRITSGSCPSNTQTPTPLATYAGSGTTCTGCSCTSTPICTQQMFTTACDGTGASVTLSTAHCTSFASTTNYTFGPYVAAGTCDNTGNATLPSVTTSGTQTFCGAMVGGGCSGADVCAPKQTTACIMLAGAVSCPSSYPTVYSGGTTYADRRKCSMCSACSVTAQGSCTSSDVVAEPYATNDCTGSAGGYSPGNYCNYPAYESVQIAMLYPTQVAPTCSTSSSTVSGGVTTSNVHTICCQ